MPKNDYSVDKMSSLVLKHSKKNHTLKSNLWDMKKTSNAMLYLVCIHSGLSVKENKHWKMRLEGKHFSQTDDILWDVT